MHAAKKAEEAAGTAVLQLRRCAACVCAMHLVSLHAHRSQGGVACCSWTCSQALSTYAPLSLSRRCNCPQPGLTRIKLAPCCVAPERGPAGLTAVPRAQVLRSPAAHQLLAAAGAGDAAAGRRAGRGADHRRGQCSPRGLRAEQAAGAAPPRLHLSCRGECKSAGEVDRSSAEGQLGSTCAKCKAAS